MRLDQTMIDVGFGFREMTATQKLRILFVFTSEGKEIIDISDFAEVRTDGIEEN